MNTLKDFLKVHDFFAGLSDKYVELMANCGENVVFEPGTLIFREGEPAEAFYVLRYGQVGLVTHTPARGPIQVATLQQGDVLGWSWLMPPYRWHFDARSVTLVRAVKLHAECIRAACEEDHTLGYDLMKRFSNVMLNRLMATRVQVGDVYG